MTATQPPVPKEDTMIATRVTPFEVECREFAEQYPTPNVLDALAYAESGRLTWEQVHRLFMQALTSSMEEDTCTATRLVGPAHDRTELGCDLVAGHSGRHLQVDAYGRDSGVDLVWDSSRVDYQPGAIVARIAYEVGKRAREDDAPTVYAALKAEQKPHVRDALTEMEARHG